MATAQQLKALRRKYHLGEFRRSRTSRKVYKHPTHRIRMAKRKRTSHRRRSGGIMGSGVWSEMMGVVGYVAFENYLEPKIPLAEPLLSFAELGAGLWLSKKGGFMGSLGKAAVIINIYQLSKYYLSATMGGQPAVTGMFAYS